jgi:outer membrane protein assembly factor BamB
MNGEYLLSVVNASLGTQSNTFPGYSLVEDANGNLLIYYINSTAGTQWIEGDWVTTPPGGRMLQCWNSTQCLLYPRGYTPGVTSENWRFRPTFNGVYDFAPGIMWAAPIPTTFEGNDLETALTIPTGSGGGGISSDVVFMDSTPFAGGMFYSVGYEIDAGFSATDGRLLWMKNNTRVPYTLLGTGADYYIGDGYYTYFECGALKLSCFSLRTGDLVWSHTIPNARAYDSLGGRGVIANGVLYMTTYGGNVYAYDLPTGNLLWQYSTKEGGIESPYAYYSLWVFMEDTVADGKLFVPEGHMYSPPLYRGCEQLALNITDGTTVWSINAFNTNNAPAISEGIMTNLNAYDNQIYAFGKGPTKLTVTAPDVGVTTATPITIRGNIIDISAGTKQGAVAANFPNGLPCISDESMGQWMEHVYMQQPLPSNTTGVPISIDILDSNNNYRNIGTATSDASGFFNFVWTPDITGDFKVIATFAGSESYYGTCAETSFYASEPPSTQTPINQPTQDNSGTTIMYAAIAIIVVIIIGFAITVLLLRKR